MSSSSDKLPDLQSIPLPSSPPSSPAPQTSPNSSIISTPPLPPSSPPLPPSSPPPLPPSSPPPLPPSRPPPKSPPSTLPPSFGEDEEMLAKTMGFSDFNTTKGKPVPGNKVGAVHVVKKRRYRQYMNRKGGFNRPLDKLH